MSTNERKWWFVQIKTITSRNSVQPEQIVRSLYKKPVYIYNGLFLNYLDVRLSIWYESKSYKKCGK